MDVRCERCKAQYHFEDAQVGPAGLTVQCSVCKHVFVVKKKVPAAADPASEYRIRLTTGQVFACRDLTTLQKWIVERRVARDDEVAPPGETYRKLGELHELDTFFEVVDAADRAAAEPPPPPPPPAGPPPRRTAARVTAVASQVQSGRQEPLRGDFGATDDLDEADHAAIRSGHGARNAAIAVVGLLAVAGGTWVVAPDLVGRLLGLQKAPAPAPAPAPTPPPAAVAPPAPEPRPVEVAPPPPVEKPPEPAPPAPAPAEVKPKGPKALVAQAERLRDRGELEKALDLYDRAIDLDPENVAALAGRGLCYLDLESYEQAAKSFQEALRVDPENADALLGAGEAYRSLGRKPEAIRHYERYLLAYPNGDEAPVARNALEQLRR